MYITYQLFGNCTMQLLLSLELYLDYLDGRVIATIVSNDKQCLSTAAI